MNPQSISNISIPRDHLKWLSDTIGPQLQEYVPIYRLVVAFRRDYFGRKIVRRSTQRPRDVRDFFGEPKISDFQVAMPVEQQVLWFQVPVDDVPGVEIVESQRNLRGVELGYGIREALFGE